MKTVISTRFRSVFIASMSAMTVVYVMVLTDNIIAGQLIGAEAVEAITLIFPIITFLNFISYLIADGLVMMASYAQGHEDREEVDRLFSMGMILSIVLGVIFSAIFILFKQEILMLWGISEELMSFAENYYSGIVLLPTFLFVAALVYTFFVEEGKESQCVIAATVCFVVNVLMSIILCHYFGVFGIGVAIILGSVSESLISIYFLTGGRSQLHFKFYWDFKKILRGFVYSFYHTFDMLCMSILPLMISSFVIKNFGEEHIIVASVGLQVLFLVTYLYTGLTDCFQPMICQYHAENNLHCVEKTMKIGIKATVAMSLAVTVAGMVFSNPLSKIFGVENPAMIEEIETSMMVFLPFLVFFGCTSVFSNHYIYIEKLNYGLAIKILLFLIFPYIGMNIGGSFSTVGFWLGLGGSFLVTFLLNYVLIKIHNKNFNVLMTDKKILSGQLSYDVNSNFDEIMALTKKVDADLKNFGFNDKTRNKLVLFIEEIGLHAVERCQEKIFQLEFSILPGENNSTTLAVRDNGEPYDIIKTSEENIFSFREFFIESMTSKVRGRKYLVSGDENRFILRI